LRAGVGVGVWGNRVPPNSDPHPARFARDPPHKGEGKKDPPLKTGP